VKKNRKFIALSALTIISFSTISETFALSLRGNNRPTPIKDFFNGSPRRNHYTGVGTGNINLTGIPGPNKINTNLNLFSNLASVANGGLGAISSTRSADMTSGAVKRSSRMDQIGTLGSSGLGLVGSVLGATTNLITGTMGAARQGVQAANSAADAQVKSAKIERNANLATSMIDAIGTLGGSLFGTIGSIGQGAFSTGDSAGTQAATYVVNDVIGPAIQQQQQNQAQQQQAKELQQQISSLTPEQQAQLQAVLSGGASQ
jgi:hypothetical protein